MTSKMQRLIVTITTNTEFLRADPTFHRELRRRDAVRALVEKLSEDGLIRERELKAAHPFMTATEYSLTVETDKEQLDQAKAQLQAEFKRGVAYGLDKLLAAVDLWGSEYGWQVVQKAEVRRFAGDILRDQKAADAAEEIGG